MSQSCHICQSTLPGCVQENSSWASVCQCWGKTWSDRWCVYSPNCASPSHSSGNVFLFLINFYFLVPSLLSSELQRKRRRRNDSIFCVICSEWLGKNAKQSTGHCWGCLCMAVNIINDCDAVLWQFFYVLVKKFMVGLMTMQREKERGRERKRDVLTSVYLCLCVWCVCVCVCVCGFVYVCVCVWVCVCVCVCVCVWCMISVVCKKYLIT